MNDSNEDARGSHQYRKSRTVSVAFTNFEVTNPRSSLATSILVLIALFEVLCGVVLPLSDSFSMTVEGEHKYYLEVFLLLQYIGCIVCLSYLMVVVHIHMKKIKKSWSVKEKIFELSKVTPMRRYRYNTNKPNRDFRASLIDAEEKDDNSLKDEERSVEEEIRPVKHDQVNRICFDDSGEIVVEDEVVPQEASVCYKTDRNSFKENKIGQILKKSLSSVAKFLSEKDFPPYDVVNESGDIGFNSEGVNLYLRLGAVGFGFGVMMHDGFKISDQSWAKSDCRSILWIPKNFIHLLYTFLQTYFIFKYHKIVFKSKKNLFRYLLLQLVVTNVCQWFKTVVYEINEEMRFEHLVYTPKSSNMSTGSDNHQFGGEKDIHGKSNVSCHGLNISEILKPFLFPCAIEYSLISMAIFYKMFQKVGFSEDEDDSKVYRKVSKSSKLGYSSCHKSNKGFFLGLILFLLTLVALALFFILHDKEKVEKKFNSLPLLIYQCTEIILQVVSLITCIAAFLQLRSLQFRKLTEEESFDDNLLLIGLSGILAYDLFILIPSVESIPEYGLLAVMFIIKSIVEMAQCLTQSFFIFESSQRCADSQRNVRTKPGRSMVMFLFVSNLAMWLVNTFEVKRAENNPIHSSYYKQLTWNIVTHMLLPLIIFFRFHSTVCLSDIWNKAYKPYQQN